MTLSRSLAAAFMATASLAFVPSPASAGSFTVTDILGGGGDVSFTIPRLEVVDGNMTEADIRAVFGGGDLAAIAGSLASWDAAALRIPELRYRQVVKTPDAPEATLEMTYRDLTVEGLQDGVAQSSRIGSGDLTIAADERVTGSFGAMTSGMIDLGGLVGLYAGGDGGMKTIYRDVVFEGGRLSGPEGFACELGRFSVAEFKARPLNSFARLVALAASADDTRPPSPEELRASIGLYAEVIGGMEISPGVFDGASCRFTDEQGRPGNLSIGRMAFEGFGNGRYGATTIDDLDVSVTGGDFFKAGRLVFKPVDLNGVLEVLRGAGDGITEAWLEQNFRKLIGAYEGFAVEDVSFDVPDETNPGQRIKGAVGAFDLTLKAYRLGVPTDISIAADRVAVELPAGLGDAELARIKALGYDRIELSSAARLRWDEASSTILVDELSASGTDVGSFRLSAVIGNAGEALFAEDPNMMQAAALGLSVRELSVTTEDRGGFAERLYAQIGREQGQDPAAIRTQFSGVAAGMIPMMLGGTEEAQEIAGAVMTFLNGGSSLTVRLVAKDAAGLGFMDFMAAMENPAALVGKVDISAEAQ